MPKPSFGCKECRSRKVKVGVPLLSDTVGDTNNSSAMAALGIYNARIVISKAPNALESEPRSIASSGTKRQKSQINLLSLINPKSREATTYRFSSLDLQRRLHGHNTKCSASSTILMRWL